MSRQHQRPIEEQSDRKAARVRRPLVASWAAVALAVGITLATAGASTALAAPLSAASPAAPGGHQLQLSATPSNGLPATNAKITVRGSGFDRDAEVWIAVCQDDGVAPEQFSHCLGGAIPDSNASSAWAVVTRDGKPRYPGPVSGQISKKGDFKVELQIPVATGQDADCVSEKCSVYTRSADPNDQSQDASVPVSFSFAGPSRSTGTAPSTEVIGAAPTTVAPDSVSEPEARLGSDQTVVFSGFTAGEVVDATLYSNPIPLESVQADPGGRVQITFTVPDDLPLGEHLVQAIGRQSGLVGVAQFTVVAAVAATTGSTATEATETAASMTASSAPADPTGELVPGPATAESTTAIPTETTAVSTAQTTDEAVAAAPNSNDGTGLGRLIWLWIILGALIVIGGAAAVVAMLRRRAGHTGHYAGTEPEAPVDEIITAPSWQQADEAPVDFADASEPADVPDTAGWPLFAAQSEVPAESYLSAEPFVPAHTYDAAYRPTPPPDQGPSTEQWKPDFDAGPSTEQWKPEFDAGPDPSSEGGRHRGA